MRATSANRPRLSRDTSSHRQSTVRRLGGPEDPTHAAPAAWARLVSVCLLALGRLAWACLLELLTLAGWMLHGRRGQPRSLHLLLLLLFVLVVLQAGLGHPLGGQ